MLLLPLLHVVALPAGAILVVIGSKCATREAADQSTSRAAKIVAAGITVLALPMLADLGVFAMWALVAI